MLTETVSDKKIIVSTETIPSGERIAERKTIVYETRTDPIVIKMAAEKLKDQLFTRFWFLRPNEGDVQFVSIDKYYEAFMVISGKYFIDYYRKCAYTVQVDKEVRDVVLHDHKFDPIPAADPRMGDCGVIRLEGEEHLTNEFKASLILDRCGRDVTLDRLPSAPSERNPKKTLETFGVQEVARDADLNCIRPRVAKRPANVNRLVSEFFEVNDRAVIYAPRFRVVYRNVRTGEEKAVEFDGVTAQKIGESKHVSPPPLPPAPPAVLPPPREEPTR
jgi:hypothetical protein